MAPDLRKVIGSAVTTHAFRVTAIQECNRRYGVNAKTKVLEGTVQQVILDRSNPTGRAQTYVKCEFDLGNGRSKIKKVHLRFLKLKQQVAPTTPTETVAATVIDNTTELMEIEIETQPINNVTQNDNNLLEELRAAVNSEDDDTISDTIPALDDGTTLEPPTPNEHRNVPEPIPSPFQPGINLFPTPTQTPAVAPTAAIIAHGIEWEKVTQQTIHNINGPVPYKQWGLPLPTGEIWREGDNIDEHITRLDVFLQMFPKDQLHDTFLLTNLCLRKSGGRETTKSEILKFFGILILCTCYEFNNRSDLWSEHPPTKYEACPQFGRRTGMSRNRFDELWTNIRFSLQPDNKPDDMSSEKLRWMLVEGFIMNFNTHRAVNFIPSDRLVVDESFSRWYGQGGGWINHGLPHFVAMDRKPEDGCEIQYAACGRTEVMIQLCLVKSSRETEVEFEEEDDLNHGSLICLKLIRPWFNTSRVVVTDSFFASVELAKELLRRNTKFVGVIKTSHQGFPLSHLQSVEMGERGECQGLISRNEEGNPYLLSFVWLDKDRRYFISTCSDITEARPFVWEQWRQLVADLSTPPEKIELTIAQPAAAELYYSAAGKIDQHNRGRQSTLSMETKIKTHDWSHRVNITILSMCIVDSWRVWSRVSQDERGTQRENQKTFYGNLAAELIDHSFESVVGNTRNRGQRVDNSVMHNALLVDPLTGLARGGEGIHLRTSTRTRRNPNHVAQGRCKVCHNKTRLVCSECATDNNSQGQPWICNPETSRMCFATHRQEEHQH